MTRQRWSPASVAIIFESKPPMLWPTITIRSRAASDRSGSTFRRTSARFSLKRWAEYGIGSPVE